MGSRENPPNYLVRAPWWRWDTRFLRQLVAGAFSHLVRRPGGLSPPDVMAFFAKRTVDPTVFDGRTEGFYEPLLDLIATYGSSVIVDLGCGDGALYEAMRQANISVEEYFGLDFAAAGGSLGPCATIITADITAPAPDAIAGKGNRTCCLVNTLCYLARVESVALLESDAGEGDVCLLIEPYPGWFWDRSFDGIAPRYRYPAEVAKALGSLGWTVLELRTYQASLGNFIRFPVAYSLVARRR